MFCSQRFWLRARRLKSNRPKARSSSRSPAASRRAPDKESFTGNITWRHAPSGDELLISTPTGQGVAQILRQGDAVLLRTSEPREYRAADSEELTERVLGFRLPIEGLAQTVQGKPSPALEGRGWKVEYQEYDAQRRPTRLRLTNAGAEVRLAIHQWN